MRIGCLVAPALRLAGRRQDRRFAAAVTGRWKTDDQRTKNIGRDLAMHEVN
jgi:hypothetical protein